MCPGIASKFCSVLQAIIITIFYVLIQYCEFRWLSLYHKDSFSALCLASKVENSPKTSMCCCPTFCAVIVGIKIKSFENEVKVLQCFTPSQLNDHFIFIPTFSAAFSALAAPSTAVCGADPRYNTWGVMLGCLHGRRLQQLCGPQHCVLQHMQCLL